LPQIDLIVIYTGRVDINNSTVSQSVGIEPGAEITSLGKVSYPTNIDIYNGGFSLSDLLASIPGRLIRGISGAISGLLSSDEEKQGAAPSEKKEISLEDLSPSLIRQLKRLLKSDT
jgi:hypothetical protein